MANEIWKDVPSQPEIMASSLGRIWVKPCSRPMPGGGVRTYTSNPTYGFEEKTATARPGSPRRMIIRVSRLRKTFKIHQLVCEAFHGPKPSPTHVVLHLNEDPSVNIPENLRWGTRKENQHFPKAQAAFRARIGERSPVVIHRRNLLP